MSSSTTDVDANEPERFVLFDLRHFKPRASEDRSSEIETGSNVISLPVSFSRPGILFKVETQTHALTTRGPEGIAMSQELVHGDLDQSAVSYDVKIEGGKILVSVSVDLAAEAGKLESAFSNPLFKALIGMAVEGIKKI